MTFVKSINMCHKNIETVLQILNLNIFKEKIMKNQKNQKNQKKKQKNNQKKNIKKNQKK